MSVSRGRGARGRIALASLALCVTAAACGTTVPGAEQLASAPGGSTDPFGLPGSPSSSPPSSGLNGPGSIPGTTGSLGPGSPLPGGSSSTGPALFSRGVTATKIRIGVIITVGYESLADTFGYKPPESAGINYSQVVRDDINRRGGIAGRQIEIVPFEVNVQDPNFNSSVEEERACEYWKERPVFAAFNPGGWSGACLAKAGIVLLNSGYFSVADEGTFREFPSQFESRIRTELVQHPADRRRFTEQRPKELQRCGHRRLEPDGRCG